MWLWRGWLALLLLTLACGTAIVARGSWQAIHARSAIVIKVPAAQQASSELGAAQFAASDAQLPTQAGATGTTVLPPLPIPAAIAETLAAAEPGVVAARPFSLGRAGAVDRARALQCLADAIYYEAASEPDQGQRAVAQVILNRVRHPAFPATVCGVVYQGSQAQGCQFSFACDGATARLPSRTAWMRAARSAGAALAGYVYAPVGLATHYHTYAVTPAWNRSLVMTDAVGAHLFHRWKGYWGTAAAFHQIYAGGEPIPGPLAPLVAPLPPTILAGVPTPLTPLPAAGVLPTVASAAAAPPSPEDHLPPASTVLDRWKDSGKPL